MRGVRRRGNSPGIWNHRNKDPDLGRTLTNTETQNEKKSQKVGKKEMCLLLSIPVGSVKESILYS